MELIDIVLKAGRSAVELSLFILLPIMVVMLALMRLLEARGVMDWVVARLAPVLKPVGLTGLSVFWFGATQHIVANHLVSATEGVPAVYQAGGRQFVTIPVGGVGARHLGG